MPLIGCFSPGLESSLRAVERPFTQPSPPRRSPSVPHVLFMPGALLAAIAAKSITAPHDLVLSGDEAFHALRVKRLTTADAVALCDGAGVIAQATITSTRKVGKDGWELSARVTGAERVPPALPRVHIFACAPKGDLLEHMIDQLSQCGVEQYTPLLTARTIADHKPAKPQRLARICEESLKQSGRAWLMQLNQPQALGDVLESVHPLTIIADASGPPWSVLTQQHPALHSAQALRILIGPEGGFAHDELVLAQARGALAVSCGPHILRIETAAVAMAALAASLHKLA